MTDPTPADGKDGAEPRLAAPAVRRLFGAVLPVVVFAVALGLLHRLLSEIDLRSVVEALHAVPLTKWLLALAWTAGSYLLPRILLDVSRLVSGGVLRTVSRHGGAR